MAHELNCTMDSLKFASRKKERGVHRVNSQNVYKTFEISHKLYDKCTLFGSGIYFQFCNFIEFPSARSLLTHFHNINLLCIQTSQLSHISAKDFEGYKFLRDLYIEGCQIEYLPGDLFKHTPHLEVVSFYDNKIKRIDEGALTLQSLKHVNLLRNDGIDYCYSTISNIGSRIVLDAKIAAMNRSSAEMKSLYEDQMRTKSIVSENLNLKTHSINLENELMKSKDDVKKLEAQLKKAQEANKMLKARMKWIDESTRDFTVVIKEKKFKVHKFVLKAKSNVFAKLINQHPDMESFELNDISVDIFKKIGSFMYTEKFSSDDVSLIELFKASCLLEVDSLADITAKMLEDELNSENALEILFVCNKIKKHDNLKMKAFDEFKKIFPNQVISIELASQPDFLEMLLTEE